MASTVLVKDVLRRASVLLQDMRPQFTRFAERDLVNSLNDAERAICKYLPQACSRIDAIKLRAGTRQSIDTITSTDVKLLSGSSPTATVYGTALLDVLYNMGSDGATRGRAIRRIDAGTLDASDPTWRTLTGSTVKEWAANPANPREFEVNPGVTGTVWVGVHYAVLPIPITAGGAPGAEVYAWDGASSVAISVDDEWTDDLVNYIAARAHMSESKHAEPAKAAALTQLFVGSLNAKSKALAGVDPKLQELP